MTDSNFGFDYSVPKALLWGNCKNNFDKATQERKYSIGERISFGILGVFEAIPVLGQVISLAETGIVQLHRFRMAEKTQEKTLVNPDMKQVNDAAQPIFQGNRTSGAPTRLSTTPGMQAEVVTSMPDQSYAKLTPEQLIKLPFEEFKQILSEKNNNDQPAWLWDERIVDVLSERKMSPDELTQIFTIKHERNKTFFHRNVFKDAYYLLDSLSAEQIAQVLSQEDTSGEKPLSFALRFIAGDFKIINTLARLDSKQIDQICTSNVITALLPARTRSQDEKKQLFAFLGRLTPETLAGHLSIVLSNTNASVFSSYCKSTSKEILKTMEKLSIEQLAGVFSAGFDSPLEDEEILELATPLLLLHAFKEGKPVNSDYFTFSDDGTSCSFKPKKGLAFPLKR